MTTIYKKMLLKQRLLVTCVLIPIVIYFIFFLPLYAFTIINIIICMLSAWEWSQLAGLISFKQRTVLTMMYGLFLIITILFIPKYIIRYVFWVAIVWWLIALLLILIYPHFVNLWNKSHLLILIFGLLTILPFFWGILILRQYHYDIDRITGSWWLLYIMILVWGADSGAYIFGNFLGNYKLIPKISPNKTWEGLIGGILTSTIISLIFPKYFLPHVKTLPLVICSLISILASIIGDLIESMLKREAGLKDSSHLFPGHGGILDLIDSMTAAVPVFVFMIFLIFNDIILI